MGLLRSNRARSCPNRGAHLRRDTTVWSANVRISRSLSGPRVSFASNSPPDRTSEIASQSVCGASRPIISTRGIACIGRSATRVLHANVRHRTDIRAVLLQDSKLARTRAIHRWVDGLISAA